MTKQEFSQMSEMEMAQVAVGMGVEFDQDWEKEDFFEAVCERCGEDQVAWTFAGQFVES